MYKRCEGNTTTPAAGLIFILMYYDSLVEVPTQLEAVKSARKTYKNMAGNAPKKKRRKIQRPNEPTAGCKQAKKVLADR